MPSDKRLIARADDLGSFKCANRAILETFQDGLVRNASLLVVAHHFAAAADLVREEKGLCLGLHATITAEWDTVRWRPALPPEKVPALVDSRGHLVQRTQLAAEAGATAEMILAEVAAQLARARAARLDPVYLDCHMGFDWIDNTRQALAEFCRREGLIFAHNIPELQRLPSLEVEPSDPVRALAARLRAAAPGLYLLVGHPAYECSEIRDVVHEGLTRGDVGRERDNQRRMFVDPLVLRAFEQTGWQSVRYDEV